MIDMLLLRLLVVLAAFVGTALPQGVCRRFYVRYGAVAYTGSTARIECREGFAVKGKSKLTCSSTERRWKPDDKPQCVRNECKRPELPNGKIHGPDNVKKGNVLYFSCDSGYRLEPPTHTYAICEEGGDYNRECPKCVDSSCERLREPRWSQVTYTNQAKPGSVATFTCDSGFVNSGTTVTVCLHTGKWTSPPPICYRSGDTAPPTPTWATYERETGNRGGWGRGRETWSSWGGGSHRPWSSWTDGGRGTWSSWSGGGSHRPWSSWTDGGRGTWNSWSGGSHRPWSSWTDRGRETWSSWGGGSHKPWSSWTDRGRETWNSWSGGSGHGKETWSSWTRERKTEGCERFMAPRNTDVTYTKEGNIGSVAIFKCETGYIPSGTWRSVCRSGGLWSSPPPKCYLRGETRPPAPTWASWAQEIQSRVARRREWRARRRGHHGFYRGDGGPTSQWESWGSTGGSGHSWSSWGGTEPERWSSWGSGGREPWSSWSSSWNSWSGSSWNSWTTTTTTPQPWNSWTDSGFGGFGGWGGGGDLGGGGPLEWLKSIFQG